MPTSLTYLLGFFFWGGDLFLLSFLFLMCHILFVSVKLHLVSHHLRLPGSLEPDYVIHCSHSPGFASS